MFACLALSSSRALDVCFISRYNNNNNNSNGFICTLLIFEKKKSHILQFLTVFEVFTVGTRKRMYYFMYLKPIYSDAINLKSPEKIRIRELVKRKIVTVECICSTLKYLMRFA